MQRYNFFWNTNKKDKKKSQQGLPIAIQFMVLDSLRCDTAGGAEGGDDGCGDGCNHLDDELQCFFLTHNGFRLYG